MDFDQWVGNNNPDKGLSYGKGWWDFVEYIRRFSWLLDLNNENVEVIDTFELHTPPPQEVLISPIVRLHWDGMQVYLKEDFGNVIGPEWSIGIVSQNPIPDVSAFLFTDETCLRKNEPSLMPDWVETEYEHGCKECTVRAQTELNAYAILRTLRGR